jgi:hypothetical protein
VSEWLKEPVSKTEKGDAVWRLLIVNAASPLYFRKWCYYPSSAK